MPWCRLDESFYRNDKQLRMSDAAFRVYVCALSYCAHTRDPNGYLSEEQAKSLIRSLRKRPVVIEELVKLNAWERTAEGYLIHDFELYLPRSSVERVRRWREDKRRAGLTEGQLASLREQVFSRDGPRCRYCGQEGAPGQLVVDRINPEGGFEVENLVAACRSCNRRKGGRNPSEAGMELLPVTPPVTPCNSVTGEAETPPFVIDKHRQVGGNSKFVNAFSTSIEATTNVSYDSSADRPPVHHHDVNQSQTQSNMLDHGVVISDESRIGNFHPEGPSSDTCNSVTVTPVTRYETSYRKPRNSVTVTPVTPPRARARDGTTETVTVTEEILSGTFPSETSSPSEPSPSETTSHPRSAPPLEGSPPKGGPTARTPSHPRGSSSGLTVLEGSLSADYEAFVAELNRAVGRRFRGDAESRQLYARARKNGRSAEDLLAAARGVALSPHHMGQNDAGLPYNAPANVLRSRMLDTLIGLGRGEIRPQPTIPRAVREAHHLDQAYADLAEQLRREGR
jgi:hypothetical protein